MSSKAANRRSLIRSIKLLEYKIRGFDGFSLITNWRYRTAF